VLLTRANYDCGSSREHAPWALLDFGFKAIIAESFADIFFNNCYKNGIVPIVLPASEVEALFQLVDATPGYKLVVDLQAQAVIRPDGCGIPFQIDAFRKECLINGWDDIGLTLRHAEKIREFEEKRRINQPWLFA
jgi:3-isopropylmalate/(R)-2-methylmalate dehydratase small subunit